MNLLDENFIIALCFLIFIYFSYKPIRNAIISSLDAKINDIKNKLSETEKLRNEAKSLLLEVEKEMDSFELQKNDILNSAQVSTKKLVELRKKESEILLTRHKNLAIESINTQKKLACNKMKSEYMEEVLDLVTSYLKETNNNSASDKEILQNSIQKIK